MILTYHPFHTYISRYITFIFGLMHLYTFWLNNFVLCRNVLRLCMCARVYKNSFLLILLFKCDFFLSISQCIQNKIIVCLLFVSFFRTLRNLFYGRKKLDKICSHRQIPYNSSKWVFCAFGFLIL